MEDSLINSPNKSLRSKLTKLQAILTPKDITIRGTKRKKCDLAILEDERGGMADQMRTVAPVLVNDVTYGDLTLASDENELDESLLQAKSKNIQRKYRRQFKNVSSSFSEPVSIAVSHHPNINNTYGVSEDEHESSNESLNLRQVKETIINQRKRRVTEIENDPIIISKQNKKLNLSTSLSTILEEKQLSKGESINFFSLLNNNEDSQSSISADEDYNFDLQNKVKSRFHRQRRSINFKLDSIIPRIKENSFHTAPSDSERISDDISTSYIPPSYEGSSVIQKSQKKTMSSKKASTTTIPIASNSENLTPEKVPGHSPLKSTTVNDNSMVDPETDSTNLDESDEGIIQNEVRSRFTRQRKSINFNLDSIIKELDSKENVPMPSTILSENESSGIATRKSPRKVISNKETTTASSSENKTPEKVPGHSPLKSTTVNDNSMVDPETDSTNLDESDEGIIQNEARSRFTRQRKSINFNLDSIIKELDSKENVPMPSTIFSENESSGIATKKSPKKVISNKETTTASSSENKTPEKVPGHSSLKSTTLSDNSMEDPEKDSTTLDKSDEGIIQNEARSRFTRQRKSINFNLDSIIKGVDSKDNVPMTSTILSENESSGIATKKSPKKVISNKESTTASSSENKTPEKVPGHSPLKSTTLSNNSMEDPEMDSTTLDKSNEGIIQNEVRSRFTRQRKSINFNNLDSIISGLDKENIPMISGIATRKSPRKVISNKETTTASSSENKTPEKVPGHSPLKSTTLNDNSMEDPEKDSTTLDKSDEGIIQNEARSRFTRQRKSINFNLDSIIKGLDSKDNVPMPSTILSENESSGIATRKSPRKVISNKETTTASSSENKTPEKVPGHSPLKSTTLSDNSMEDPEKNSTTLDKSDEGIIQNEARSRFTRQRKSINFNLDSIIKGLDSKDNVPMPSTILSENESSGIATRKSPRKVISNKETTTASSSENKTPDKVPGYSPMKSTTLNDNSMEDPEKDSTTLDKSDEGIIQNEARSRFTRQRKSINFNLDSIIKGLDSKDNVPMTSTILSENESSGIATRKSPRKVISNKETTTASSSENKTPEKVPGYSPMKSTTLNDNSMEDPEKDSTTLDKSDEGIIQNEVRSRFTRQRKSINFNLDSIIQGLDSKDNVPMPSTILSENESSGIATRKSPRKVISNKETTTASSSENKTPDKVPGHSPLKSSTLNDNSMADPEMDSTTLDKSDAGIIQNEVRSRFTHQRKSINFNNFDSIINGLDKENIPMTSTFLSESESSGIATRKCPKVAMLSKELITVNQFASSSENRIQEEVLSQSSENLPPLLHDSIALTQNVSSFEESHGTLNATSNFNQEQIFTSFKHDGIIGTRKDNTVSSSNSSPRKISLRLHPYSNSLQKSQRQSHIAQIHADVPQTIGIKSLSVSLENISDDKYKNMLLNSGSISSTQSLKGSITGPPEQQASLQIQETHQQSLKEMLISSPEKSLKKSPIKVIQMNLEEEQRIRENQLNNSHLSSPIPPFKDDNLSCASVTSDAPTDIFEANNPPNQGSMEFTAQTHLSTKNLPHLQQNIPNLLNAHASKSINVLNRMNDHHDTLQNTSQKLLGERSITNMHAAIQNSSPRENSLKNLSSSDSMHVSASVNKSSQQSFRHLHNYSHSSLLKPSSNSSREISSSSFRDSVLEASTRSQKNSSTKFGHPSSSKSSSLKTIHVLRNKFSTDKNINDSNSVTKDAASKEQLTLVQFLEKMSKGMLPARKERPSLDCLLKRPAILDGVTTTKTLKTVAKKSQSKSEDINMSYKMNKNIFEHFSQHKVTREGAQAFHDIMEDFWTNLVSDIDVLMTTTQRSLLNKDSIYFLLKQLKLFSSEEEIHSMLQELLPMDEWQKVIPTIYAFNRVFPQKK